VDGGPANRGRGVIGICLGAGIRMGGDEGFEAWPWFVGGLSFETELAQRERDERGSGMAGFFLSTQG